MVDIESMDLSVALVHGKRNRSGQLPSVKVCVTPADRAERISALDKRIETARKAEPMIIGGTASLAFICMASVGWLAPGLAAVFVLACMLQAKTKYRKGG